MTLVPRYDDHSSPSICQSLPTIAVHSSNIQGHLLWHPPHQMARRKNNEIKINTRLLVALPSGNHAHGTPVRAAPPTRSHRMHTTPQCTQLDCDLVLPSPPWLVCVLHLFQAQALLGSYPCLRWRTYSVGHGMHWRHRHTRLP